MDRLQFVLNSFVYNRSLNCRNLCFIDLNIFTLINILVYENILSLLRIFLLRLAKIILQVINNSFFDFCVATDIC